MPVTAKRSARKRSWLAPLYAADAPDERGDAGPSTTTGRSPDVTGHPQRPERPSPAQSGFRV